MYITWEDRKNIGSIDGLPISEKPIFSFGYAWILLTDETAQYVESHNENVFNKGMTEEQIAEVVNFYNNYEQPIYEPTFEELKLKKLDLIKQNRESIIGQSINNFQAFKLEDRENIQGSIQYFDLLSQGTGFITWTMADNTEKQVTKEELQNILDSYVIRKAQAFAEYQSKKQAIERCTTVGELESIIL